MSLVRSLLVGSAGVSVLLTVLTPSHVAGQDATPSIRAEPVAGNVHVLYEPSGGNVGVSVGDDGVLIVDDLVEGLDGAVREAIASLSDADIAFVLNTHWHLDHAGNNEVFGAEAPIVAHANTRQRLSETITIEDLGMTSEPLDEVGLPIITFADSVSIHFNGEEIRAIHVPESHTDGDAMVWFVESNVVHMGDLFFNGIYPFVDRTTGGNVVNLAQNIGALLERIPADATLIPGHGPVGTVDDLRAFHTMLVDTIAIVRGHIEAGRSLAEIRAEEELEAYPGWDAGFVSTAAYLGLLYASLSAGE